MTPASNAGAADASAAKSLKRSQSAPAKAVTRGALAEGAATSSSAQPSVRKTQSAPKKKATAGRVTPGDPTGVSARGARRAPAKASGRAARATSAESHPRAEALHEAAQPAERGALRSTVGPSATAGGTGPAQGKKSDTAKKAAQARKTTAAVDETATKETVTSAVTPTPQAAKDRKAAPRSATPKPASRADAANASEDVPQGSAAPAGPYADDERFLAEQRQLLDSERTIYEGQASDLKAEADSLAQEREPGDVQFDEESGEGGTVTVDRERDLALSAQALAAVEEIDAALARIDERSYGACERCQQPIPKARLKALPYARLCVACKSGGLSRR